MIISSERQFEQLLRHPRFYAVLSGFTDIRVTCPYPEQYRALVSALGVRNRSARIAMIYDGACDRIDRYNTDHGLNCTFYNGHCGLPPKAGRLNGCCYECRFQSSSGCPTRNLTCKFYFCPRMRALHPLTPADFPEFRLLTLRQQYMLRNNPYCTREMFLKLLGIGSIVLFLLCSTRKVVDMERADRKNRRLEREEAQTGSPDSGT